VYRYLQGMCNPVEDHLPSAKKGRRFVRFNARVFRPSEDYHKGSESGEPILHVHIGEGSIFGQKNWRFFVLAYPHVLSMEKPRES
jgi:hypothetical protein